MKSRHTPHLDAWRSHVEEQLKAYGTKVRLARWLAEIYGGDSKVWEGMVQKALRKSVPNGELLLAINCIAYLP